MNNAKSKPIGEGLFTWPTDKPALLGSRCAECARVAFPVQQSCAACGALEVQVEELPQRGTLWSWTIQRFMPKAPYNSGETAETFRPYGVGYIELPGALRVEGRLLESDPVALTIGMPMEVVFEPYRTDPDGTQIVNFAFRAVPR